MSNYFKTLVSSLVVSTRRSSAPLLSKMTQMALSSPATAASSSSRMQTLTGHACSRGGIRGFSTAVQEEDMEHDDNDDDEEDDEEPLMQKVTAEEIAKSRRSLVHHPFSINEQPLDANLPSPKMDRFAIVALSGTQFKVCVDDTIVADHRDDVDIGDVIDYPEVLLVGSRRATVVGQPYIPGATIRCAVEELTRDKKVITFKTRRRKSSRSTRGFRRRVMILRVQEIVVANEDDSSL